MARSPPERRRAEGVDVSEEERLRIEWVLAQMAGECTAAEACDALGISESRLYQLRDRALAGVAMALRRRRPGRPAREDAEDPEKERLRARVAALEEEVVIERTRAELARELPHLLDGGSSGRRGKKTERPPGSVAGRGRASGGRRRVVRPPDSRADESDA